ncbi:hypothetical protein KGF57_000150 [Candida theae]|uniref:Phosphatidate phosphatase APP1 catalytic domain-containing protein n=1 Tax=Candida theae TaxID=1198502 RepID=A0AAD5BK73_9ASCO|nr:uncharacterized protein KGF57_000150 [Candida theae]KAI5968456.1 hypothetical protein KGF57_000150 [Candida theae]
MSRRQRLIGLAKSTRDNYIPKITGSVTSLASGASKAFTNPREVYDEDGKVILPKDTRIKLYPTYTRRLDNKYFVDVSGWMSAPGAMNRKNRVMMSVIKQLMKREDPELQDAYLPTHQVHQKESDSDNESIHSVSSNQSASSSPGSPNSDAIINERLADFFAKSIPNSEIKITIGSESKDEEEVAQKRVMTDGYGYFHITVEVSYKPSVIFASSTVTETIFAAQDIMIVPESGLGVISDIDDTVKLTGVVGDKRLLLRNLLLQDFQAWKIPSIVKWYMDLSKRRDVSFFYVSNSPWQLFPSISEYFNLAGLPKGSIHLKRYLGSMISSLLEPSSSRKKTMLHKILKDFPEKKFVCIGDSGEYDLEAYVDLAISYPNRVLAIYIRYVENSLSVEDDRRILKELLRLLAKRKTEVSLKESESIHDAQDADLIDLSDSPVPATPKKKPPMKPKKPESLHSRSISRSSDGSEPPLNKQPANEISLDAPSFQNASPPIPPSSNVSSDGNSMIDEYRPPLPPRRSRPASRNGYDYGPSSIYDSPGFLELEERDKKGAEWIQRVTTAITALRNTNTQIHIFIDTDDEFFKSTCSKLDEDVRVK